MGFANDALRRARPVSVDPGKSSYWNAPQGGVNPKLFTQGRIRPWVRNSIIRLVTEYLDQGFNAASEWVTVWLAGSAVSLQWDTSPAGMADLDCLVGIDFPQFRAANQRYRQLSDIEISNSINEGFYAELGPQTKEWNGFELTFYVNPGATDIRAINPYAAYNLTDDSWTVTPQARAQASAVPSSWTQAAIRDQESARDLTKMYSASLAEVQNAVNPAHRVNAERKLKYVLESARGLFHEIHSSRRSDFSPVGQGYWGPGNYRWQAGKQSGAVPAMKALRDYADQLQSDHELNTYGVNLPSVDNLIIRAALYQD